MKNTLTKYLVAAVAAWGVAGANAADYQLNYAGPVDPGYVMTLNTIKPNNTYNSLNASVGLIKMNVTSGDSTYISPIPGSFWTYCVDPARTLDTSSQAYELMTYAQAQSIVRTPNGAVPDWLSEPYSLYYAGYIYNYVNEFVLGNISLGDVQSDLSLANAPTAAQFKAAGQLAVWEVLYDSRISAGQTIGLSGGNFYATHDNANENTAKQIAEALAAYAMLSLPAQPAAPPAGWDPIKWVLVPFTETANGRTYDNNQALLVIDNGNTPPVPDGGLTIALLGVAIAALGGISRKLRK